MGFYYISIFSIFPLGIAYGLLSLVFWAIARLTRAMPGRKVLLGVVGAAFLVLPVAEELWIAWNFGQACKGAGTVIQKKVQVEGFYDSTMRSAYENTKPGSYIFVEQATEDRKGIERVERADDRSRAKALAWYAERNPGKGLQKEQSVIYSLNDKERIVVFSNGVDAWRVTRLDRPTARYHFNRTDSGTRVAHKIVKSQTIVVDSENDEQIARYTRYGRGPSWFFIGLDVPGFACDAPGRWPLTPGDLLIFEEVLIPAHRK